MKTLTFQGSPFATGQQLGQFGYTAWHRFVVNTPLWRSVTSPVHVPVLAQLQAAVREQFPAIWQELEGLAAGLDAPFGSVFAWNCRGDLVPSTSDGCTTVAGFTAQGEPVIAHNEDGYPQLFNDCALVTIQPDDGVAFTSFAYPGSICGHTFSVNAHGIVNTVNNIRAQHRPPGLPRQVLARAALNASTLDEAVAVLTQTARAGAFHHTLSRAGEHQILSVEATGSGCSVREITQVAGHANHLVHPALANIEQVVTGSSASRQHRLEQWRSGLPEKALSPDEALAILSDTQSEPLPVYRQDPQDPDDENTLATAVFTLQQGKVGWQVYRGNRNNPENQGVVLVPE